MVRLTPRSSRGLVLAGGIACATAAVFLSGCSETTYGTGVNPGTQTLKDIAGIALIKGKQPAIDYEPRGKVVAPPTGAGAPLPPPESGAAADTAAAAPADSGDANPPNWPNDPDLAAAKFKADVAAREARGEPAPKLKLPPGSLPDYHPQMSSADYHDSGTSKPLTADQQAAAQKAFADAKGSLAKDANGNPVRRYLTEPPVQYRQPDPTQPVVFTEKKKKFHWWWQKGDDAADNLTPADTGDSTATAAPTVNPHD
jgi:hypothetical protein